MSEQFQIEDGPPIESTEEPRRLPMGIQRILQVIIIACLPIFLVLGSVRLVMTEQFLKLEYQRPGFPDDKYGFSTDDRLKYGPYGVRYLLNNEDISYLENLKINGHAAFNADELQHMEDVKVVTRSAFQVLLIVAAFLVGSTILLVRVPEAHPRLRQALRLGGRLTLGLVALALVIIIVAWGFFFDSFHGVFFESGTWQFANSDTLIRLYPEQFWFDAALTVAILTLIGTAITQLAPWYWEKRLAEATEDTPATQD